MSAMLRIVIEVNAPPWLAHAVKEDLAMYVEQRGDCRVLSVKEVNQQYAPSAQTRLQMPGGENHGKR